jgi:hypothetical protein
LSNGEAPKICLPALLIRRLCHGKLEQFTIHTRSWLKGADAMNSHIALTTEGLTRRNFITISASLCAALLLPRGAFAASDAGYYVWNRDKLLAEFGDICKGAEVYLSHTCGYVQAREIITDALSHFASILPGLPDIGGEENKDLVFLVSAAHYYAFYKAMKPHGLDASKTGRMMYDLCAGYYTAMPKEQKLAECTRVFSRQVLEKTEQWCSWTQLRQYPANWVALYKKGNGVDFTYGYDMTECAIVKYFRSLDAFELQPYFCTADFPRSQALGTGLVRTKALGFGDECCNFRYLKGRKVVQDWESETKRLHPER